MCRPTPEHTWKDSNSLRPLLLFFPSTCLLRRLRRSSVATMAFSGRYELESQENYEEFLEVIGTLVALQTLKCLSLQVVLDRHVMWLTDLTACLS